MINIPAAILETQRSQTPLDHGVFRFGSLPVRFFYSHANYPKMVAELFRLSLHHDNNQIFSQGASIYMLEDEESFAEIPPSDGAVLMQDEEKGISVFRTDVLNGYVFLPPNQPQLVLAVRPNSPFPEDHLPYYTMVVINKFLFLLGRLHLHAAAVMLEDKICLFFGDKGCGKTSISIQLGLQGHGIIAEDHIILYRAEGEFLVSGCDGNMRLTQETEKHFFKQPLPVKPKDFGGVYKKEIALDSYTRFTPYQDRRVDQIYFPQMGDRLLVSAMSAQQAVLAELGHAAQRTRFVNASDQEDYLTFIADLFTKVPVHRLTLTSDLADLQQLAKVLQT